MSDVLDTFECPDCGECFYKLDHEKADRGKCEPCTLSSLRTQLSEQKKEIAECVDIIRKLGNGHHPDFEKGDIETCHVDDCEICTATVAAKKLLDKYRKPKGEKDE